MSEDKVSIVGTKQSGKTTTLGLLDLATAERASKDGTFTAILEEKTSSALDVADELCRGYFPPRTPQGQIYEADFVMHWKNRSIGPFGLTTTRLRLPIVEMAGEDLAKLIAAHSLGLYKADPRKKYDAWSLYQNVLQSVGFIFIVPCTEIRGLEQFAIEGSEASGYNADTNIARLFTTIIEYKERTKASPIKGAALLLTKYDLVMSYLKSEGLDLSHPNDATRLAATKRFLTRYMRNTNRLLNFYDYLKDTVCLPSWVDLAYDEKTGKPLLNKDDGSPKIDVNPNTGLPYYSGYYYDILISMLRETFAS